MSTVPKIIVDPNSFSATNLDLTVSLYSDVTGEIPDIGDVVDVIQPDEDAITMFTGRAVVVDKNDRYKLLYLRVDWHSFVDVPIKLVDQAV